MRVVRFVSHEKEIITTDSNAMRVSGMVRCKEKNLSPGEDLNIHMLSLKASLIIRIVRWAEHHCNDNDAQSNANYSQCNEITMTEWDDAFIRIPLNTLLSLHLAAVIFSIPELVEIIQQRLWRGTCNRSESDMLALFESANARHSPELSSSSDDDTTRANKAFRTMYNEDFEELEEKLVKGDHAHASEKIECTAPMIMFVRQQAKKLSKSITFSLTKQISPANLFSSYSRHTKTKI